MAATIFVPFCCVSTPKKLAEPLSYQRKQWLRQRRLFEYETIEQQVKPKLIKVEECGVQVWPENKYIRYCVDGEINYVSDNDLKYKSRNILQQLQQKPGHKLHALFDIPSKQIDMPEKNIDFCYMLTKSHNNHRYFNIHKLICRYCKERGHLIQDCRKLHKRLVYRAAYICYKCHQRGHISKHCLMRKQFKEDQSTQGIPYKMGLFIQVNQKISLDIEY